MNSFSTLSTSQEDHFWSNFNQSKALASLSLFFLFSLLLLAPVAGWAQAPTPATTLSYSHSGSTVTVSFAKPSSATGFLVLKINEASNSTPTVSNTNHTGGTFPAMESGWSNRTWTFKENTTCASSTCSFSENIGASTVTYLIYTRNASYQYSTPVRVIVSNANYTGSFHALPSIDGLYLMSGTYTPSSGAYTFTANATSISGSGTIFNQGTLNFKFPTTISTPIINDYGTINALTGSEVTITKDYSPNSSGPINVDGGKLTFAATSTATLQNSSIINVKNGGILDVNGPFIKQTGKISVESGGQINFNKSFSATASGDFTVTGTNSKATFASTCPVIIEAGNLYALSSGQVIVNGSFTHRTGASYFPSVISADDATITFSSTSSITLSATTGTTGGNIVSKNGAEIQVNGTFSGTGSEVTLDDGTLAFSGSGTKEMKSGVYRIKANGQLKIGGPVTAGAASTSPTFIVESSGAVEVLNTGTLQLTNSFAPSISAGASITVDGNLTMGGSTSLVTPSTSELTFRDGSTFTYNRNGGSLPLATWSSGSTATITGVTATLPNNLRQDFHNLTWNCPQQSSTIEAGSTLNKVVGTLTVENTNNQLLVLGGTTPNAFGNLTITGGKATLASTNGGSPEVTIKDDFTMTGGSFYASTATSPGLPVVTIGGDLRVSGGTFGAYGGSTSPAYYVGTLNFTNLDGTHAPVASSYNVSALSGNAALWRYKVQDGREVTLESNIALGGSSATDNTSFTVESGSHLIMGTHTISPSAGASNTQFTLQAGGHLSLGDRDGLTAAGINAGNILTDSRSFASNASYTYNGTDDQVTGNGLPAMVDDLTIDNNVMLSQATAINNSLSLSSGTLSLNGKALTINGKIEYTGGTMAGDNLSEITVSNLTGPSVAFPALALKKLTLARTNGASLLGNMTIHSEAIFTEGTLNTGVYKLILQPASTLSETAIGYVLGKVETSYNVTATGVDYTFSNIGVTAKFSGRGSGLTKVTRTTGAPATLAPGQQSIERVFDFEPTTNTGLNAVITMTYLPHELNGLPEAELGVFSMESEWKDKGASARDASANRVSLKSVDGLSQMTLSKTIVPMDETLPVELINFTAQAQGSSIYLTWRTASEMNNQAFTIERSTDTKTWVNIGQVQGAGNSNTIQNYSYKDFSLPAGTVYYRLKQTDYDGQTAYSKVVSVQTVSGKFSIQKAVLSQTALQMDIWSPEEQPLELQLLDMNGRTLQHASFTCLPGQSSRQWQLPSFAPGIYVLVIRAQKDVMKQKILLSHP
ncbi:MAG: beta strand repeat-containing protein [Rufibacter sp.]